MRRQLRDRRRTMTLKPRRLGLPRSHPPSQHNLKRPLTQRKRRSVLRRQRQILRRHAIEMQASPIQLLLQTNHRRPQRNPGTPPLCQRDGIHLGSVGRRNLGGQPLRHRNQLCSPCQDRARGDREVLQLRAIKLVEELPWLARPVEAAVFAVENLLHPETRNRRIQQPQQPQMRLLRRALPQLDHRRGAVEHLPAAIQHKVVMRRHKRECNRERHPETSREEHRMVEPSQASLLRRLTEVEPVP